MNSKILKELNKLSTRAYLLDEIPVGAVVVKDNKIVGKGYNNRQRKRLVTGHAEIMAINKAAKRLGDWRLDDCVLYVTLKPCPMCEEVIKNSRIKKVYYLLESNTKSYQHSILKYQKIMEKDLERVLKKRMDSFFQKMR